MSNLFSPNPAKAAVERWWLLYTPVWGILAGGVMLSGLADHWTDLPLMAFALLLAVGAIVPPILRRNHERDLPWHRTTAWRFGLSVILISFFGNYSWCPYFYDVLHMHYGFQTQWNIRNNPTQMYVMTVPYFATYAVLLTMSWRLAMRALAGLPRLLQLAAASLTAFAVAFLETLLNANPWLASLFCYDDMKLMLTFGTFFYGMLFVVVQPVWVWLDEDPDRPQKQRDVWLWCGAAMYASVLVADLIQYEIAPHFTTVEAGAWQHNLRDWDDGCLIRPD
ncbi:MAG: hypothetical protein D6761_03735 [Candidatus Dadabacteria bacterium]|nr:MAG: hypothetical protein D6761_03735 [Candidatus Dadabacteria bacterium]